MNYVGKRRLLKLATFLEQLPPKLFDLRTVTEYKKNSGRSGNPLPSEMKCSLEKGCGTVGCAMGWAPAVFRDIRWCKEGIVYEVKGEPYYGYTDIATQFFGLTEEEADFLFHNGSYRSKNPKPTIVAKRIRQFCEDGLYLERLAHWEKPKKGEKFVRVRGDHYVWRSTTASPAAIEHE